MSLLLPLALLLPSAPTVAAPQDDAASGASPGQAIAAIESGEYDRARSILTALLAEEKMAAARELMAADRPLDALPPLDELLVMDPRNARAWLLRGRAALAAADQGHQQAFLYGDALQSFERSLRFEPTPAAHLGASRAALASADFEKALAQARKGNEGFRALAPEERPELAAPPERTLAEAAYRVYIGEKQREEGQAAPYFAETEGALMDLLGRTPEDAWPWMRLAELYQWEQRGEDAARILALGLEKAPDDQQLHSRHVDALRNLGGRRAVVDAYQAFNDRHPGNALGVWYQAGETVYLAVDDLLAGQDATSTFEAAERLFQRCRELESSYTDSCIGYELVCRNGVGWCRFNNEDLDGAREAFLSMEELKQGGLEWQLEGALLSGVRGLEFVADRYSRDNRNPESLARAAEVYDYLRHYAPDNADFANNSGFFHRDAAVAMEVQAMYALSRAEESEDEAEAAGLRERAAALRARAQELMARSYDAYVAASALIPEDVRVVNDTGLIMTYYVRTDAAQAERYLNQAVAAAEVQIPALEARIAAAREAAEAERAARGTTQPAEGEAAAGAEAATAEPGPAEQALTELVDQLDQLREAYGDAHENFGILYLTLTGEPERARAYLEKCVEIGPRPRVPRVWVRDVVLPICDEVLAGNDEAVQQLAGRVWLHAPGDEGGSR